MHFIIGILISAAALVWWLGRASEGARNIADAANELSNLPRKRRFAKNYNKSGYSLVETSVEAATVLMISIARMCPDKRVTDQAKMIIMSELRDAMGLSTDIADGVFRQMNSLTYDIVLPESSLFPMVKILRNTLDKAEATGLAGMMLNVAKADDGPNPEQKEFLRGYSEHMGLLH